MAIRCGTDLTEVGEIEKAIDNERFIEKIFTDNEKSYCDNKGRGRGCSYAARFAAKEAVSKALGTGYSQNVRFKDIEVVNNESGEPRINLYGGALDRFNKIGAKNISLSLTHTKDYAQALAIIEI